MKAFKETFCVLKVIAALEIWTGFFISSDVNSKSLSPKDPLFLVFFCFHCIPECIPSAGRCLPRPRCARDWIIVFGDFLGNLQNQTLSKVGNLRKFEWHFLKLVFLKK